MGYWKDRMIQQDEQGWSFAPDDRFVCGECFDDDALKEFIGENAKETVCDYCDRESEEPIAARINEVMDLIGESLYSEWGHPDDEMIPYDSSEGGYQYSRRRTTPSGRKFWTRFVIGCGFSGTFTRCPRTTLCVTDGGTS